MTDIQKTPRAAPAERAVPAWEYGPAPESRDIVKLAPGYGLFIGGRFVEPRSGRSFETIDPANEERLADVAEEFNRYNERQLTVRDPSLADIRISGVYSSTDPALLVRFLRGQAGIRMDESSSATVISAR